MFIHTLILSSAIVAAPQAQTPPRTTPETPPAGQQAPAPRGADKGHAEHGAAASADAAFVKKAADGGMAEVKMAQLAKEKAEHADVKAFAERLERDHTQANTELKALASSKQITLPDAPSPAHQAKHDKLAKLSGAEFDRAFVAAMLEDHQKDVREFSREASNGKDAEVKAFAAKTLPTLKEHLQQVQSLSKTVGKKPTS
jgi:putative membrane protein